ncbi:hypothetical protein ACKVMT_17970 [Halobacteriales archaeon Cl-PHB]
MKRWLPAAGDVAMALAVVLAVLGVWLPWVSKRPTGYFEGTPSYTSEGVPGLETGISGADFILIWLAVGAVLLVLAGRIEALRLDGILVLVGVVVLWTAGNRYLDYSTAYRYVVEPGLYILLASGLFFLAAGLGMVVQHRLPNVGTETRV